MCFNETGWNVQYQLQLCEISVLETLPRIPLPVESSLTVVDLSCDRNIRHSVESLPNTNRFPDLQLRYPLNFQFFSRECYGDTMRGTDGDLMGSVLWCMAATKRQPLQCLARACQESNAVLEYSRNVAQLSLSCVCNIPVYV